MAETSYFGLRKITRMSKDPHPAMLRHREHYYRGMAWANELAKRGYVVLVQDTFTFGSRRMRLADLAGNIRSNLVEGNWARGPRRWHERQKRA